MRFSRLFPRVATLIVAALLFAAGGLGAQSGAQPLQIPRPTGFVNDFANVIPPAYRDSIQSVVDEVRQKSGGEIAVVTFPTLGGRSRDEVGLQILREWGVGSARQGVGDERANNGAVILVVPSERQLKIELGYGTNTFVTAGEAGRIRDTYMFPEFRRDNYGRGIYLGVVALAQEYAENYNFQLTGRPLPQPEPERRQPSGGGGGGGFLIFLFILFIIIASRGGRGGGGGRGGRRRRGWGGPVIIPFPMGGGWGGGGFGGGGGGFGGGGFGGFGGGSGGGGGAGGEW